MADAYLMETVTETDHKFGDSLNSDIHGGMTAVHTLQHEPHADCPSYIIIQTDEVIDSRDNPVKIVRAPSGGADWTLIGHLTRGAITHVIEIDPPALLDKSTQINIQTSSISGVRPGDEKFDPGKLDDFGVTSIQILYRPA